MHDWVLYFKYHMEVNYSQVIYYFSAIFSSLCMSLVVHKFCAQVLSKLSSTQAALLNKFIFLERSAVLQLLQRPI